MTSAATINGSILKGPVNAATVCAFKPDANATGKKGAQVAVTGATATNNCVATAADGSYSLSLPTGTTGDLIIEAGGGTFCSNEAAYDATAKTCAGTGGTPIALLVAKLSTVIEAPAAEVVASAVVTPLSTSSFANMVAAGLASVVAFRSQFTALVTTTGLPSSLSAATLANDPTLQGVLASLQKNCRYRSNDLEYVFNGAGDGRLPLWDWRLHRDACGHSANANADANANANGASQRVNRYFGCGIGHRVRG